MSRIIATAAVRGAHKYVTEAETKLKEAIETYKPEKKVGFPNTAYHLPLILALLGLKVETLKDCQEALSHAKDLLPPVPEESLWLPYLGNALDAGIATLIAEEIIEALKYLDPSYKPEPPWLGFTDDTILRTQGIKLVDGRMPGFAACVGALPTNKEAVELARALQERNILVFIAGDSNGRSMAEQLAEEGIDMNWDTFLVPYGKPVSAAVFALNFAARAAMTFGGIKPGGFDAARKILLYNKERVFAFVLALGADPGVNGTGQLITDEKYATAAGAINFGFPVIAYVPIPQILPRGICTYEHVVSGVPLEKIVHKAVEVRGLKLKMAKIPIPVPYGAGFEGERVRKENLYVEFGGKYSTAFELLRARPMDEVEDGKIELLGPDIDQATEGGAMPLGVLIDVAGRNLKADFEPVLERRIHHFISCINGVMHIGQRDIPWVRISKEAYEKGFRLRHYGEVLIAKFKDDFGALVDKVQVKLVTDQAQVEQLLKEARDIYRQRDERVMGMKDEDVDKFYSCILCVPAGEEIVLADGSFLPVEKLIEQAVESDVAVLSWDGCSLSSKPVEELFINPAPAELMRITLQSGSTLTLTPNHKVLVDRDGLEWVAARELKAGDGLLCAQTTHLNGADPAKTFQLIDLLPDNLLVQDADFLAELRGALLQRFGSWAKAAQELKLDYHRLYAAFYESPNPKVHPRRLTLAEIEKLCSTLGLNWEEAKTKIRKLGTLGGSTLRKQALDEELLYAAGLVAADGCVLRRGHGVSLQFTNTEPTLIEKFKQIIEATCGAKPRLYRMSPRKSRSRKGNLAIQGRREVFVARVNDQLAGRLMKSLGIGGDPQRKGKWTGEIISTLSPDLVAAFLRGLFDGDGSVRLRQYAGKWDIAEAYVCISDERAARHLQLLLRRLGIVGNLNKSGSVWKIVMHGANLRRFAEAIPARHPEKQAVLAVVHQMPNNGKLDKTQEEVLPYYVGRALAQLPASRTILSPSTLYYYKSGRSRPVAANVQKVLEATPGAEQLRALLLADYFLDAVTAVETVKNTGQERYEHVYNTTLADIHCYFANTILVKNCGCFECIVAVLPETNGVMVVNREFNGMTPIGMTFSTMAGEVGGGVQTPGFLGVGKLYLTSEKFISAEGGIKRLVWMPSELKEEIRERMEKRLAEIGMPELLDKIATEKEATTTDELMAFLQRVGHPALEMEPIIA